MKILFIGGTGRLSKDVAKYALDKNYEVFLMTRGSSSRKIFVEENYRMLYTDVRDVSKSKALVKNLEFDVVIDFLSFNVNDIKNILEIIEDKFKQYIFVSSATVYVPKKEEVISEETTLIGNENWAYAKEKYLCEKYLEDYFGEKTKKFYTIVRPYVTYGNTRIPYPLVPRNNQKEWTLIERIMNDKAVPILDVEPVVTTLLHTRDFAKGIIGLCLNKKAYGEAFHITNDETTTWETVIDILEKITGHNVKRVRVSKEKIYEYMPEYEGVLEGDKTRNMRFDNSKISSVVPEFVPSVDLKDGLEEMFSFYKNNPEFRLVDEHWDWCMDKICEESSVVKKNVVIYGAGDWGKKLYRFLDKLGVNVAYFCQSEVKKEDSVVYGTKVISYEQLDQHKEIEMIFIAIADKMVSESIKHKLESSLDSKILIIDARELLENSRFEK